MKLKKSDTSGTKWSRTYRGIASFGNGQNHNGGGAISAPPTGGPTAPKTGHLPKNLGGVTGGITAPKTAPLPKHLSGATGAKKPGEVSPKPGLRKPKPGPRKKVAVVKAKPEIKKQRGPVTAGPKLSAKHTAYKKRKAADAAKKKGTYASRKGS